MTATGSTRASWPSTLLAWIIGCALVLPFCFEPVWEPDAGWHLAIGRAIASTGLPRTNLLTWPATDQPWYPTAWLFDVALYQSHGLFGPLGLQLLTAALAALTLLGLAVACRSLHAWGPAAVPALAMLLVPRVMPRPHLASWAAEAWVLAACLAGGVRGRIACVPLIALASNFHAGAVFPLLVLVAFCGERARAEKAWLREGAIVVAGGLALLANPGALFNLRDNVAHLSVDARMPNHEEFQHGWPWLVPAFYVAALVALAAAWAQRRERPAFLPLTLLFSALGVFAVRFASDFPILAAPVLAGSFPLLDAAGRARVRPLLLALFLVLGLSTHVGRIGRLSPAGRWDEHALPVRAAEFVQAVELRGRSFNAFEDGGYLEFALPDRLAFQDGRVMAFPPTFFLDQAEAQRSPQAFQQYLQRLDVEWALTPPGPCSFCGAHLLGPPGWALLYWDDTSELYVRGDVARLAGLIAEWEFRYLRPRETPAALVQRARTLAPPEKERFGREAERFAKAFPESPYAPLLRCAGGIAAGCEEARRQDDSPEWQALVQAAGG